MPPQQGNRLLDFVDGAFGFGAHGLPNQRVGERDIGVRGAERNCLIGPWVSTSALVSAANRNRLIFDFRIHTKGLPPPPGTFVFTFLVGGAYSISETTGIEFEAF
jgi:hypothetical protein